MNILKKRICSVCKSDDFREVFDQPTRSIIGIGDIEYHHKINLCNNCGFVFASPVLSDELILRFYEKMSNYEHPYSNGLRPIAEIKQIERYVNSITSKYVSKLKGRVLDIGCSTAYGLYLFKNKGWDVLGLDPSDKCIELSKKHYDISVIKGTFDLSLFENEKPFNIIILCHVLEHLVYPDIVIEQLHKLINEDGVVYIEVPNLMKPYAPKCYFGFEHVNFFTPTSLVNLISVNGFEVVELHEYDNGPEISPFYPVIGLIIKKNNDISPSAINNIKSDKDVVINVINEFAGNSKNLINGLKGVINKIIDIHNGRLALWGAGIHTSQILSETALGGASVHCIFDNDAKKNGSELMGIPIIKFPSNIDDLKKNIDAILISSEASEDAIYNQISYLEESGIKVYRLYNKAFGVL